MNIALFTIDSLRFDAAQEANTPFLYQLMHHYQREPKGWFKVGAQGTYTLPAHISMFQAGILPSTNDPDAPPLYNRNKLGFFKPILSWNRKAGAPLYPTPDADNIIVGFEKLGYRTVGVGGVSWFDTRFQTSGTLWTNYFKEFVWRREFGEKIPNGFENQIDLARELMAKQDERPLFFFMNVSSTHQPYRGLPPSVESQAKCLDYVDSHLERLVSLLPKPLHLIIVGDHGDCFGEDGLWGHSFYHPKVMEVPMVSLEVGFDIEKLETWCGG
jgi:hypothetical protein